MTTPRTGLACPQRRSGTRRRKTPSHALRRLLLAFRYSQKFGFKKTFLTTSCTDALEMAAILLDIKAGDEVIVPSFTFVSTANAFILRGAKIIFADSESDNPNMDVGSLEELITPKTKLDYT